MGERSDFTNQYSSVQIQLSHGTNQVCRFLCILDAAWGFAAAVPGEKGGEFARAKSHDRNTL